LLRLLHLASTGARPRMETNVVTSVVLCGLVVYGTMKKWLAPCPGFTQQIVVIGLTKFSARGVLSVMTMGGPPHVASGKVWTATILPPLFQTRAKMAK
jgi:hypothetical protein